MNESRFLKITLMDLSIRLSKLEDKLEELINSDIKMSLKLKKSKKLIKKITIAESEYGFMLRMATLNDREDENKK